MRRAPLSLFLSVFVGSAVIVVVAVAIVSILRRGDAEADSAKTLLANRIETARQIRQALAKPIPPPEPLGPIRAKPANQHAKAMDGNGALPKVSRAARNAMAQDNTP